MALSEYYQWEREDIVRAIPVGVKSILSVGCGAGATERRLQATGHEVTGIELNPEAAAAARGAGIEVIEGDATEVWKAVKERRFDCILFADVLEHIATPERVLADYVGLLHTGGSIVISVPNFRHYSVFWRLFVVGEIIYADKGIFDYTHLRITTERMVRRWLQGVGARVVSRSRLIYSRRDRIISACSLRMLDDFLAKQVVLVATVGGQ